MWMLLTRLSFPLWSRRTFVTDFLPLSKSGDFPFMLGVDTGSKSATAMRMVLAVSALNHESKIISL